MRIIHRNLKAGEVKVKAESLDDLWYLSGIIEPEDSVSGESERKIKIGDSNTENVRVVRKKVRLTVKAEKIEFAADTNTLRILGTITDGPDDIPRGSHHTIVVEPGDTITIIKPQWLNFHLEKLNQASQSKHSDILIAVFDRENAIIGMLNARGYEEISRLKGDVAKKDLDEKKQGNFYKDLAKNIEELAKRHKPKNLIIASPGFWKEYLLKELSEELKKITTSTSCSDVTSSSINEIMKRPELKQVLDKDQTAKEENLVEELLKALAEQKAAYGFKDVKEKAEIGALSTLLITDTLIQKYRQEGIYTALEELLKIVENTGGQVHLIGSANKKLDALGGLGGIKRWKS